MGTERRSHPGGDVQRLETLLEAARREPTVSGSVPLLENRLERARCEQADLIRQLAHQHSRTLFVLAIRFAGCNAADDVAQEAFISLATWITKHPLSEVKRLLETPKDLQKLMCRVTARRAYDFSRKRRERAIEESEVERVVDGTPLLDPQTAIAIARLERAYASLPAMQRIAHVLHHYYEFTDADIEDTLGVKKTNSRTLVHRANLALKRAMEMKR